MNLSHLSPAELALLATALFNTLSDGADTAELRALSQLLLLLRDIILTAIIK